MNGFHSCISSRQCNDLKALKTQQYISIQSVHPFNWQHCFSSPLWRPWVCAIGAELSFICLYWAVLFSTWGIQGFLLPHLAIYSISIVHHSPTPGLSNSRCLRETEVNTGRCPGCSGQWHPLIWLNWRSSLQASSCFLSVPTLSN